MNPQRLPYTFLFMTELMGRDEEDVQEKEKDFIEDNCNKHGL